MRDRYNLDICQQEDGEYSKFIVYLLIAQSCCCWVGLVTKIPKNDLKIYPDNPQKSSKNLKFLP